MLAFLQRVSKIIHRLFYKYNEPENFSEFINITFLGIATGKTHFAQRVIYEEHKSQYYLKYKYKAVNTMDSYIKH